jgi:hypothetical protein
MRFLTCFVTISIQSYRLHRGQHFGTDEVFGVQFDPHL